jgi:hypothetical protein
MRHMAKMWTTTLFTLIECHLRQTFLITLKLRNKKISHTTPENKKLTIRTSFQSVVHPSDYRSCFNISLFNYKLFEIKYLTKYLQNITMLGVRFCTKVNIFK